ncbi:hypothetical protein ERO13_D04G100250v2 [Gossypium hirsutum]|uniref:Uncharacterized protein n=1 Tax=Gossypium mustelinum TaxID=34275 RepID=A0A5D2VCY8_GOSMU|nr:hypothetical protein ERO13_D04G100250v2 [Gossypium hirsutum]TYI87189.1 hypothetical protein E1A91_D04G118400v1 [Gossypium mustelinum]
MAFKRVWFDSRTNNCFYNVLEIENDDFSQIDYDKIIYFDIIQVLIGNVDQWGFQKDGYSPLKNLTIVPKLWLLIFFFHFICVRLLPFTHTSDVTPSRQFYSLLYYILQNNCTVDVGRLIN